ncbi:MAG: hypothetical protein K2Q18_19695 [Bdellovibrionales bacterium]|nr:hypothetical protein [Bdellovibrionales bacterium]
MAKIIYTAIGLILSTNLYAASCCGGGQSAASVMIADHLHEWTFSSLFRDDIGQTNNDGKALIEADGNTDQTATLALEYKRLFGSRFQANMSFNYIQKKSERVGKAESSSGLGDVAIGGFYEALTNYNYSSWTPRLFTGIKVILPFGENNFNSKKVLRTDIRGTGFYKIDVPIVAVKEEWKLSATPQYFPTQKNLAATYAFTTAGSYSHSFNSVLDLTGTLQWSYLAKKSFQGQNLIAGQYWELSLSPSWMIENNKALNLTYNDSTLIGKSRNSALYRSIALGMTWSELL